MNDKYTQKAVFTNRREVALLNVLLVKQKTEEKTMTTYAKTDIYIYRSVPQIRPPFYLSTKCRGGLYAGCNIFSRDYALLKGEEAGRFREVAGVSIVDAGGPCSW